LKTWKKVSLYTLLSSLFTVLGLIGMLLLLFRIPSVQTRAAKAAAAWLEGKLGTEVRVEKVYLNLWTSFVIEGLYVADLNHDTLIYAGKLDARFSKVRLLNRKLALREIKLQDAVFHLHRDLSGDSMNLTMLLRKLSGPTDTSSNRGPFSWELDLERIELLRTDFAYLDDKTGLDLQVSVPLVALALQDLGLEKKLIRIDSALISRADVSIDIREHPDTPPDSIISPVHFLAGKLNIEWGPVHLEKCRFRLDNHTKPAVESGMDYSHLLVEDIDLKVRNGGILADTIYGSLENLSAREKCGFVLQTLTADSVRVSTHDIELKHMLLVTPESRIGDYIRLDYSHFRDFRKYVEDVRMEGHFAKADISLKDINYFARKLGKAEHLRARLSGLISGTVDRLRARGIDLRLGEHTILKGDLSSRGLPDIRETSLNLRIDQLATRHNDINKLFPGIKLPDMLSRLGTVSFSGNFDGFISDFVARGQFVSEIGTAQTDVNFKYNDQPSKSTYSGNLSLQALDLGVLSGKPELLGKISAKAKVNGRGLNLASLKASLDGKVQSLGLKGYTYRDLEIDGEFRERAFSGHLAGEDEHYRFRFDGLVNLNEKLPEFKFTAIAEEADLYALHFTKDSTVFSGIIEADFRGNHPDNLLGTAVMKDLKVVRGQTIQTLSSVSLRSELVRDKYKNVQIYTDNLSAEMSGDFQFSQLPGALKNYLVNTFTRKYQDTSSLQAPQEFIINATIKNPDYTFQLLDPEFKVIGPGKLSGYINSRKNEFNVRMNLPFAEYGKMRLEGIAADIRSGQGKIDGWLSMNNFLLNDSLLIDTVRLSTRSAENGFFFRLDVANKMFRDTASLMASLYPYMDSAVFHLDSSSVWLGQKRWGVNSDHLISFKGSDVQVSNLRFGTGPAEYISLNTYRAAEGGLSLRLMSSEIDMGDLMSMIGQPNSTLRGSLNGTLSAEDVRSERPKIFANLNLRNLGMGSETFGDLIALSSLEDNRRRANISLNLSGPGNSLDLRGSYNLAAPDSGLDLNARIGKLSLGFLNIPFFKTYVKDVKGSAHGNFKISGPISKPVVRGGLEIDSALVTVSYLNTRYALDHEEITLTDGVIDVGNLTIYDEKRNPLFGSGRILHDHFRNIRLDMSVNTRNGQMLNTGVKENSVYYGQIYAAGTVTFKGPVSNIEIRADAKTMPNTHFAIPINSTVDATKYSFYRFTGNEPKDSLKKENVKAVKVKGISFKLQLEVTPDARLDLILDPLTGDILTSVGKGDLKLDINPGNINLFGIYEIVQGSYLFTLQNVVNKKFELDRGGTITFAGNIYRAQLNTSAVYEVRTSVYDLISDLIASSGGSGGVAESEREARAKNRIPVKLLLNLRGVLEKPDISFDIRAIDPDPTVKTLVDNKMQIIRNNDSELNKQVFGLLVMNKFLPANNPFTPTGGQVNIGGSVANTVSEFVSNQLSQYVNNWLSNFVEDFDLNLGYRQYDALLQGAAGSGNNGNGSDASQVTRRELQLAMSKRFLNNRLSINAGGNVDIGSGGSTPATGQNGGASNQQNTFFTGDFEILYALTKDRSIQAKAFNRTDWDNFNQRNRNRTGIGLSYQQDFDKLGELFDRISENRKERKLEKAKKKSEKAQNGSSERK